MASDREKFNKVRSRGKPSPNGKPGMHNHNRRNKYPVEASHEDRRAVKASMKYGAMSGVRMYSLVKAAQYVHRSGIRGDAVICGVGLGGSALALARAFRNAGDTRRPIWLYDTYDGAKRHADDDYFASQKYVKTILKKWCPAYDQSAFRFVQGMVEDTIPGTVPDTISILHLDTDWYESTKHELIHLWPLLSEGGVVLIDDYGCWESARRATDEYFAEHDIHILLTVVDHTGRIGVKGS